MTAAVDLAPLVEAWLPTQRWYAGKGRDVRLALAPLAELAGGDDAPAVTIWTVRADFANGDRDVYQLPLVLRDEPVESLEHVLVGSVETADGPRWVYDALHDKDVTPAWLRGMRAGGADGGVAAGALSFSRFAESAEDIPVEEASLVLSGEQSNTSMVFGDVAIMKVFRRLHPGVNPDIEVQAELSRLGARHIPRLLGAVSTELDGEPCSLAMLQEFMTSGTDGWELAKASVRDLMAEADLHAEEAGGDFAAEAYRLGEAVADVHADLATAFGTRQAGAAELRERAAAMANRLDRALEIVPQLAEVAGPLRATYAAIGTLTEPVTVQRVHGDLHLGQALRTVTRWVLIDFEGEPMAEMTSRREPDSALRDVAGMLRSFEYAGHHRVIETGLDAQLSYRAAEWSRRNRAAFSAGYASAGGADPAEHGVLLRAFEADKAVYEAVYEARNRPAWLPIPLASLTRLATDGDSS